MEENGYAYPDAATKRRAIIGVILAFIGAILLGFLFQTVVRPWTDRYFAALDELAQHDPMAAKRKLLSVVALAALLKGSVTIASGLYVFHVGRQTVRAGCWPYPGLKIYRRWKIHDGESARRRGIFLMTLGLTLAIVGPAMSWEMYRRTSTALALSRPNNAMQPPAPPGSSPVR